MSNPNNLPFYHYQDIQISDATIQQQLQKYWESASYANGLNLIEDNSSQLQGKVFIADLINIISSGILSLENDYNTNGPLFLSNLATQYYTLINNFMLMNEWISLNSYGVFNFVVYDNSLYMCIQQTTPGIAPTDSSYWLYLGLAGEKGGYGIDVIMKYSWNNNDNYNVNDLVIYNNQIYVALQQNSNVTPGTNSSIWLIFISPSIGEITIGTTAPSVFAPNSIWFQTQTDPLSQDTNDPIIGTFNYYNGATSTWEPMYPNVLFRYINNYQNYAPMLRTIILNIPVSDWYGQPFYTYSYYGLNSNSFVKIYPGNNLNESQMSLYNSLTVSVTSVAITLYTSLDEVTTNLPIIIQIQ